VENMRANSWTDERDEASLDVVPEELAKGSVLRLASSLVLVRATFSNSRRVLDQTLNILRENPAAEWAIRLTVPAERDLASLQLLQNEAALPVPVLLVAANVLRVFLRI
jgi:hypothetical protein